MADLKEIKGRIQSIKSTQKITSAMMMVSSAKLRKAQNIFQNLLPYQQKLTELMHVFLHNEELPPIPYTAEREVKRVVLIAFSSDSSLCGRFNQNINDKLKDVVKSWSHLGKEHIMVYPIGDKVAKAAKEMDVTIAGDFSYMSDNPTYKEADKIASKLMESFVKGEIDRVELIYHHFKSRGTQLITHEAFLPITLEPKGKAENNLYIIEPDQTTLLQQLVPKTIKLKLYTTHVDSVTSEHAARMVAMQIATDNADNLTEELTLEYNKLRQQSITNELLDIMGGSLGR